MIGLTGLAMVVFCSALWLAMVELQAWWHRPRGIPLWPDLRRTKDLK